MAQYGILVYQPAPADPMDLPADYEKALESYPDQVAALGVTPVTGFALQPSTVTTSVRGDVVIDGPFIEAKEVVAGFFVIEAPSPEIALEVAKLNPATQYGGGVEVRPLFVPPAE
ncbi:YciI family protein [Salinispora oceanensis]|uniref:YciI family protein n=1 Tax=Salinispora oceanensis TaxID=1050199 RepID=UPI00037990CE|nr:YciI family protein [Salinispora oceanensis]